MPRPTKRSKSVILVFCEGESEQVYTDFLKKEFGDVAAIRRPASTGLFDEADNKFKKDKKYREDAEVTDEVWFFFDVETADAGLWDARMKIIKRLRSLRKKPGIKVRLLMTTGCINAENADMFRKKCDCTAVHLLRKCSMGNGISFGVQAASKLLADMNKRWKDENSDE